MKYIVIMGNVVDGLTFVGPFATMEAAQEWAANSAPTDDWWLAPCQEPSEDDDTNDRCPLSIAMGRS